MAGLTPGTTYYFQVYAYSMAGNDGGDVLSFTTPAVVSFDANTGTGTMSDQTSDTNTALSTNTFTPPSGYHFTGWNTASDGTGDSYGDGDVYSFANNLYLYAQWSNGCCQISFNSNGGSGSMTAQSVTQNTSANIKTNTYTKTGCTFSGWSNSSSGSVLYADGDSLTVTTDMTLYAIWSGCPVSGGGGGGGGGNTPAPEKKEVETEKGTPTPTPTPTPAKPVAKPVLTSNTGTIRTVVGNKQIAANTVAPVKQEVILAVAPEVKVVQVIVNGKTVQGSVDDTGKVQLPKGLLVGPKDQVAVVAQSEGTVQTVPVQVKNEPINIGNVNFDFSSAKLTAEAKKTLNNIIKVVQSHGFSSIDLSGHADVFKSAGFDNQKLSQQRAAAVKKYLKDALPGVSIKYDAFGDTQPVINKTDEASRAINRRVDVIVK